MKLTFSRRGLEEYMSWQRADIKKLRKINDLIESVRYDTVSWVVKENPSG